MKFSLQLLSALLVLACGAPPPTGVKAALVDELPYYNSADFSPLWLSAEEARLEALHTIPPFYFTNQLGQTIDKQTVSGKIYVANFFFTRCPGICPKLAIGMAAVQDAYKNDTSLLLLSHSVTPDADSVPVLLRYAKTHGVVAGKWHLLTGSQTALYTLARGGYFADENEGLGKGTDDFLHTENLILVDGGGHIRGIYNGTNQADIIHLIDDIALLKRTS
jgi:protein SCO1/2